MNKCMNCGYEGFEFFCPSCKSSMKFIDGKAKTSIIGATTSNNNLNTTKLVSSNKSNSLNYTNISNNNADETMNVESSFGAKEDNNGINQSTNNAENVGEAVSTNKIEEVHGNSSNINKNKYSAQNSLKFSIDVLMTLVKIFTIIMTICVVLELISSIICFTNDSTRILGAQLLAISILLAIYCTFRYYVIYRVREANYKYNKADVILTMFLSLPCSILMMVYKGYE